MEILTTGYLLVNSWTDWKRKEIDLIWTVLFFILTAVIYLGIGRKPCWSGMIPGVCFWLASLWRPEQIGNGDGFILMGIGWIKGLQQTCVILQTALLLATVIAVCLLATGKGRKKEIPFVPFLLAGYLLQKL